MLGAARRAPQVSRDYRNILKAGDQLFLLRPDQSADVVSVVYAGLQLYKLATNATVTKYCLAVSPQRNKLEVRCLNTSNCSGHLPIRSFARVHSRRSGRMVRVTLRDFWRALQGARESQILRKASPRD